MWFIDTGWLLRLGPEMPGGQMISILCDNVAFRSPRFFVAIKQLSQMLFNIVGPLRGSLNDFGFLNLANLGLQLSLVSQLFELNHDLVTTHL